MDFLNLFGINVNINENRGVLRPPKGWACSALSVAPPPPFYFSINLRPPALTYFKIKKIKHENINGFFKFIWY